MQRVSMTVCTGKVTTLYPNSIPYLLAVLSVLRGSELQAWTLYFSLPVLKDILPLVYIRHWALFVGALHMLGADSISLADVRITGDLLQESFPGFYGIEVCYTPLTHY